MISVVIPAHNEETVIERCLRALVVGSRPGELEVIVVCNGCTDRTADAARAWGPPVRVIETPHASKPHALNIGDGLASGFPRLYVDADVILPSSAVRRVADVLLDGPALVAAPRANVDFSGRGWLIRAFYKVWTQMPHFDDGAVGSGVYALSEEGRRRFGAFPDLTSDDGFVQYLFPPRERRTVRDAEFTIVAPRSVRGLLRIMTRAHRGRFQLRRLRPELRPNAPTSPWRSLCRIAGRPGLWCHAPAYVAVMLTAKMLALWRLCWSRHVTWERDDSVRTAQIEHAGASRKQPIVAAGDECRKP